MYIHIYIHMYIHIHIYIERKRNRRSIRKAGAGVSCCLYAKLLGPWSQLCVLISGLDEISTLGATLLAYISDEINGIWKSNILLVHIEQNFTLRETSEDTEERGLLWWSSGLNSVVPVQVAGVSSLVR